MNNQQARYVPRQSPMRSWKQLCLRVPVFVALTLGISSGVMSAQGPRRPPGEFGPGQPGGGPPREFGLREGVPNFRGAPREFPGGPPGEMPLLEASGTIQAVAPGAIRMITPEGQAWILQIPPNAKVEVLGPAAREIIRPGQLVRFVAEVDRRKGTVEAPVDSLLIFTVNFSKAETQLGVFPEGAVGMGPTDQGAHHDEEPGHEAGRGVRPGPGRAPRSARRAPGGNDDPGQPAVMRLDIRGRITDVTRQGKLVISPPPNVYVRGPLEITLAEHAEIRVDISEPRAYTMASPGDRLKGKGFQIGPNTGVVSELVIELVSPLGGKLEPGADKSREGASRSRDPREGGPRTRRPESGPRTPQADLPARQPPAEAPPRAAEEEGGSDPRDAEQRTSQPEGDSPDQQVGDSQEAPPAEK